MSCIACGGTHLVDLVTGQLLVPPSVYRTVDREHPTLIIDEADDLFYRKSDLRAIVNAG